MRWIRWLKPTSSPSGSLHHGAAHSEKSSSESERAGSDEVCEGELVLFDSSLLSLLFFGFFLRDFLAFSLCWESELSFRRLVLLLCPFTSFFKLEPPFYKHLKNALKTYLSSAFHCIMNMILCFESDLSKPRGRFVPCCVGGSPRRTALPRSYWGSCARTVGPVCTADICTAVRSQAGWPAAGNPPPSAPPAQGQVLQQMHYHYY